MFTGGAGVSGRQAATSSKTGETGTPADAQTTAAPQRGLTKGLAQFQSTVVVEGASPPQLSLRRAALAAPTVPVADAETSVAPRSGWLRRYQHGLVVIDLVTAAFALLASYVVRFGVSTSAPLDLILVGLLPLGWSMVIGLNRGYDSRFVGVGATEFQRIFHAFLHMTALVAFASFVTEADLARGFVLIALPMALCLNLLGRYSARKWLHRQRSAGRAMSSVLIVGDPEAISGFAKVLTRDRYAGMRVVGACVPSEVIADKHTIDTLAAIDVTLLGDVDSVVSSVRYSGADTVAVVSSGAIGPEKLRWISWQLEGSDTDLVVSPGLMEVAGPRLHIQPVAGLPLLHVEEPELTGFRRVLKGAFDRAVAASALLMFSPIFLTLLVAIRLTSRGPALFRQTRIGRDGTPFTMLKFRSMFIDAEARQAALDAENDHGTGVLFKMRDDPRVTSVGRLLRKFSLDELPQLINVLNGSMSLVGPRPPLPTEVARYEDHVHRRFLVKPGVTGLWQVSGRSNLAWDESVRLDLRYVENWSIAGDMLILWKTVFAVVRGTGAY